MYYVTVYIGEPIAPALMPEYQFFVVEAEQMKNRCLEIVHVHPVPDGIESELV